VKRLKILEMNIGLLIAPFLFLILMNGNEMKGIKRVIKKKECLPLSNTTGRCGPEYGRCNKDLVEYAVYCNTDNSWCGDQDSHRDAQTGDEYDWNPAACGGCEWTQMSSVVVDEGNLVQQYSGKTLRDCEKLCDESDGCRSIGYCAESSDCYLTDKELDGTEVLTTRTDCTTSYRPCNEKPKVDGQNCKWVGTAPFCGTGCDPGWHDTGLVCPDDQDYSNGQYCGGLCATGRHSWCCKIV